MVLDRTNYARNLPVYLRDLCTLEQQHPALYMELSRNGNFMGQKTKRAFSKIPIDQCTEHLICWLKQESAVIGNLDNEMTVRREQVARPELARMVAEFEGVEELDDTKHHEQYPKFQADFKVNMRMQLYDKLFIYEYLLHVSLCSLCCTSSCLNVLIFDLCIFQAGVLALVDAFEGLGNPFCEDSGQLIDLDQSVIMPIEVVESIKNAKPIGEQKYRDFLSKRI